MTDANTELPVALDAMGGDLGVLPLVQGAAKAVVDDGATIVVVGTNEVARILLDSNKARSKGDEPHFVIQAAVETGRLRFVEAKDVVTMDDKPMAAAKKRHSSMRVACDLVDDGTCGAVISTGNSGAMMAVSLHVFGRIEGLLRPAIATMLPSLTAKKRTIVVDVGANVDCDAIHLAQWGVLASMYAQLSGLSDRPAVAVLSNGEEEHKGTALTRDTLALLRQTRLHVTGFCEGRDINHGAVDVVVTDGFTGNIALKTAEGVFSFMNKVIRQTFEQGSVVDKLGGLLSKAGYARIRAELDPREYGSAPLLGLKKPAFIAHGTSDAHAVRCGIRTARRLTASSFTDRLQAALLSEPAVLPKKGAAESSSSSS